MKMNIKMKEEEGLVSLLFFSGRMYVFGIDRRVKIEWNNKQRWNQDIIYLGQVIVLSFLCSALIAKLAVKDFSNEDS